MAAPAAAGARTRRWPPAARPASKGSTIDSPRVFVQQLLRWSAPSPRRRGKEPLWRQVPASCLTFGRMGGRTGGQSGGGGEEAATAPACAKSVPAKHALAFSVLISMSSAQNATAAARQPSAPTAGQGPPARCHPNNPRTTAGSTQEGTQLPSSPAPRLPRSRQPQGASGPLYRRTVRTLPLAHAHTWLTGDGAEVHSWMGDAHWRSQLPWPSASQ